MINWFIVIKDETP